jgi:outer membrane receptor protein involved in Fe transport
MFKSIFCLMILTLTLCLGAVAIHAQTSTQGSISGTVLDPSGAVVSGASVTIHNVGTNAEVNLTSDASGFFKAPLLEPGTYRVTFAAPGFSAYVANNVTVQVGQVSSLAPHLTVGASSTSVEVIELTSVVNLESPDFSSTLPMQAIQSIPINNRRWSSLAMTTPGVVSDANGFGLVSIRGVSPLLNNVEIDGADDNQAFFSEERGRTREAYSTSGNAVREFAVNTGVYSAEYGRAAGGVITSVTKSGTNQLHGQAYFWDRESNWNAYNDYTTVTSLVNGSNVTTHIKPEDIRKIYGFTAGGALIKDKLFWIYTYDQHSHIFPVVGIPYNPQQFYTLPQAALSTGETCNTTTGALSGAPTAAINDTNACALAARQKISYVQASYDWAAMLYGNANVNVANYPGASAISDLGLNSDIGQVPRSGYQEINTPKLDWQINSKHHWSVLYHRLSWDSPGGVQTAAADNYSRDAQGTDFVKLDYGVTKLTSLITTNIGNELLYQYSRELDWEGQQPYTDYTKANITGSNGNVPYVSAGYNYGFNAGSPYYSHRPAYPDERKWQIGDVLYWNKGNHSLKFGVDAVHNSDLMNNTYESNGYFSYNWVGNLFNDIINMKNGVTPSASNPVGCDSYASQNGSSVTGIYPCYYSFGQGFGNPVYSISTMDTGIFAQDNWKFSPRLTLELGLRWDHETIPSADPNLTTATGSFVTYAGMTNNPSDKKDFGPRIGFSYDIFGKGNTVLRGGYGLYYGRVTNGNIENIRLSTGSPNGQFTATWYPNTANAPVYPNIFAAGASSSKPTSYFMSSNLKMPEVQEFDLQVQQSLGKGTYLSLSYLGGLGRRLPNFLDLNLNPTTTTKTITIAGDPNGSGRLGATGSTVTVPVYSSYGNTALFGSAASSFQGISEFISNVNSNYNAAVVEVLNRSLKSIQFDANYTWSHALDYAQNANTQGAAESWYDPYGNPRVNYGDSAYNVPNRFVAYALYKFPNLHTSNWAKYLVNDWSLNDSFQMQNGLPFTAGVSGKPSGSIAGSWNGAGGPTIIPQIGYNTFRYPRRIVDDVRLQKSVVFEGDHSVRSVDLLLNVFNIANHQNITSYRATYLYSLSGTTATYTGQDGTGSQSFKVPNNSNSSGFLYTPRDVEIAARFNF